VTPQIHSALEVATDAKKFGCVTILGGYHPSLEPDFCIRHPAIDYVVRGEGEHTFKELIDFISDKTRAKPLDQILGVSFRDITGKIVHNSLRPLEPNLDVFPLPRRELLKGKHYSYLGTRVMLMETSRGCPHDCVFCCIVKMWKDSDPKMRYRVKSVKRVMEELYSIDSGWDFVFFCDDNFTINLPRTNKILDALIASKMNRKFFFSCQSRVDTFYRNPTLAPRLAEAGFRQVFFGIESLHQSTLDAIHKKTTKLMIETACHQAHANGMSIFGGIIVGFPGETSAMVQQNIQFACDLKLDFVQFTPITAFPGTAFFEDIKDKGLISTFDWRYYNLFHPMMRTPQLSRNEMYRLVMKGYSQFYFNTNYLKNMFTRAIADPGFSWYRKIAPRWIKQVLFGGWGMLNSMGVRSVKGESLSKSKSELNTPESSKVLPALTTLKLPIHEPIVMKNI